MNLLFSTKYIQILRTYHLALEILDFNLIFLVIHIHTWENTIIGNTDWKLDYFFNFYFEAIVPWKLYVDEVVLRLTNWKFWGFPPIRGRRKIITLFSFFSFQLGSFLCLLPNCHYGKCILLVNLTFSIIGRRKIMTLFYVKADNN